MNPDIPEEVAHLLRERAEEMRSTPEQVAQRLRDMAAELAEAAEKLERYVEESGGQP